MLFLPFMALAIAGCASAPPLGADITETIAIQAQAVPLNRFIPAQNRVGRLKYMGGLWLQSRDGRFGGLSGLRWHGGTLYAVSDAGDWLAMNVREDGGRLTGIGHTRIRRLNGLVGQPLDGKVLADAEALNLNFEACGAGACEPQGASIGFERKHRVWTYRLIDGMPVDAPVPEPLPADWLARQPSNGGLEAIAGRNGVQLAISEEMLLADGRNAALVRNGSHWVETGVAAASEYKPTDADYVGPATGGGDEYLVLFRRYSLSHGVGTQLGIITVFPDRLGEAAVSPTERIAELGGPYNIDNMEGLAVRREVGRTLIYVLSDDNFSGLQRTVLLKFELLPK